MASTPKWFDRVMASSTTTGTGTYTLGSAITGYQAWSVVGDGNSAYYCAMGVDASGNPNGDWEVNLGTYTAAGTTLSRDTLLASSTGSAISWAAGTRRIFLTLPAEAPLNIVDPGVCSGRLTALTGVAVPQTDVTGAGTLYFTPYKGNRVSLYTSPRWRPYLFAELSLSLTATSGLIYDVFLYDNAGTLTLETTVWRNGGQAITGATNATPIVITANAHGLSNGDEVYISGVLGNLAANGTWIVAAVAANTFELTGSVGNGTYTASTGYLSARATLLTLQDGVYVKTGATTRRYLGTFKASGTNVVADAMATRYVWNAQNRVPRMATVGSTSSHTYNSSTARAWNADTAIRPQLVLGLTQTTQGSVRGGVTTAASASAIPGIGSALNNAGVSSASPSELSVSVLANIQPAGPSSMTTRLLTVRTDLLEPGHHFWQAFEVESGSQTSTFSSVQVTVNFEN